MRNRDWFSLMAAVVLFVTCHASAKVFDHFNNGQLDPAWDVTFNNANGWAHVESGTKLSVYDVNTINSGEMYSSVFLRQNFLAPGDFEIKSGLLWDSESTLTTMQNLRVWAYSGDQIVAEGGYTDGWIAWTGGKCAKVGPPLLEYDSGEGILPLSGTAEITMKRTNGFVSVLWNDQVMLTGYSDSVVDKLEIRFDKDNWPGANFGVLSVDYVTAVPEPASAMLIGLGCLFAGLRRRKRSNKD